jgi:hypothetical protein
MRKKQKFVITSVRLPPVVDKWLERESGRTGASKNSEIVRAILKVMDTRQTRASAAS